MGAKIALTALAMLAFAANSLLCRLALAHDHIDAASFGAVRLVAGALLLAAVMWRRSVPPAKADWWAAAMLFAYAAFFSFAYLMLPAGMGALILFGAVQLTMFAVGLARGERFAPVAWAGLLAAVAGLLYLLLPGATTASSPTTATSSVIGAILMAVAGIAWGGYSLRGRGVPDPVAATASNFARAAPMAVVLAIVASLTSASPLRTDLDGIALAVASGALTSGLGYVIWYTALRRLTALQAASVQLSVPVIAALGGVALLGEAFTPRLAVATVAILGGTGLVLTSRSRGRN